MVEGKELGDVGFKYLGTPYSQMDCQAFVEKCLADCGCRKDLAGSNAWYREVYNNGWIGSPEECTKMLGCVPKGALFIDISKLYKGENRASIGTVIDYGTSASREYTIDSYTDDSTNHVLTVAFTVLGTQYTAQVPYTSYSVSGSVITITGDYGFVDQTGVASHPSNIGFEKIANAIINSLGF